MPTTITSFCWVTLYLIGFDFRQVSCAGTETWKDGCGLSKGCILDPADCDPAKEGGCVRGLSYRTNGQWIDFELFHKLQSPSANSVAKYVAIAFSQDAGMGKDAVTYCLYSPSTGHVTASLAYNPGKYNELITDSALIGDQLGNVSGGVVNGALHCRFSQKVAAPAGNPKVYSLDGQYYPLLATGTASDQNGVASKLEAHSMEQGGQFFPGVMSSAPISFNFSPSSSLPTNHSSTSNGTSNGTVRIASAAPLPPAAHARPFWKTQLVQSHGILMLFGWWLLVACAVLIARYFKSALTGRELCGTAYWFQLHRGLNTLGVLSIATAFVCIFVAKDGVWVGAVNEPSSPGTLHAILGLTASIGAFLQPIMAVFRCDKNAPARPIFNWAHRTVGIGAFCCASAAIWFSTEFMPMLKPSGKYGSAPRAMIIFYWAVLGLAVIGLEVWITVQERLKGGGAVENEHIPMNSLGGKNADVNRTENGPRGGWIRGLLLLAVVLVAIAVTVTLACFIML